MKVWISSDFEGHYPVGTAAVIVAKNEKEAKRLLIEAAAPGGLVLNAEDFDVEEVDLTKPGATILCDGNY